MRRSPTVPAAAPRKRASRQQPRVTWVYVEPVPTPLASPEQAAALLAEQTRQAAPRAAPRPRPTRACTVGAGFYPEHAQRVPLLRLRGYWLEQLGFGIGCKLSITARNGELIVRVEEDEGPVNPGG